jgi:hypothetical protein
MKYVLQLIYDIAVLKSADKITLLSSSERFLHLFRPGSFRIDIVNYRTQAIEKVCKKLSDFHIPESTWCENIIKKP